MHLLGKSTTILKELRPFSTNVPFLYPLKSSENFRFIDVFREYRSEAMVENELNKVYARLWILSNENYIRKSYHSINSYKLKLHTATNINKCNKISME